jgi:hypothetical protein
MSRGLDVLNYFVPNSILSEIFCELLSLEDICRFDTAICNKERRLLFLDCVGSETCIWLGNINQELTSLAISWLHIRSIKIRHLRCNHVTNDIASKISSFGSCLYWLKIRDTCMVDESLIRIVECCPNLESVKLSGCHDITDKSISKLADKCPHLNSLDLIGSWITDISVVRVAEKCLKLHTLDLGGSNDITDTSIVRYICTSMYYI